MVITDVKTHSRIFDPAIEPRSNENLATIFRNAGRRTVTITARAYGLENMVNGVVEGIKKNYIDDIGDLRRRYREKTENNTKISFHELITGISLSKSNIGYCWDYIRIFPKHEHNTNLTIFPDFVTNVIINNKLLLVEYHSLMIGYRTNSQKYRIESVRRDTEQWSKSIDGNNIYTIFAGDITPFRLQAEFDINTSNFADLYLEKGDLPQVLRKEKGYKKYNYGKRTLENDRKELIKELKFFGIDFTDDPKIVKYYGIMKKIIKDIVKRKKTQKIEKEIFFGMMENYTKNQIEKRLFESPYCNEPRI